MLFRFFKPDTGYAIDEIYPYRNNAKLNDVTFLFKQIQGRFFFLKAELHERFLQLGDIIFGIKKINIDIFSKTRKAVESNGISADNHVADIILL